MKLNFEKGQGLVEYALILILVAIVVIAVLAILGPIIGNVFTDVNSELEDVSYVLRMLQNQFLEKPSLFELTPKKQTRKESTPCEIK